VSAEGRVSARLWFVTLALFVIAAVCGYFGLRWYLANDADYAGARPWDLLYYTAQMFVLSSSPVAKLPYNPLLSVALFLAPLTTVLAVLQTVAAVFRERIIARRLRRSRGHCVVVGTGAAPFVLAQRLAGKRQPTVLVGSDVTPEVARRHDLHVVPGDPMDRATLRAAGVQCAARVFALSDGGVANAGIALITRKLHLDRCEAEEKAPRWKFWKRERDDRAPRWQFWRRKWGPSDIFVYARADDAELVAAMRARRLGAEGHDPRNRFTLDFFSIEERAAVVLLAENDSDLNRSAAVVGTDAFAEAVATELRRRRRRADLAEAVVAVATQDYTTVPATAATVYVCATSPDEVMRIGLQLLLHGHANVVLCLGRRSLLADALEHRLFDNIEGRFKVFGVLDAACDPVALERSALVERLARALHAQYLLRYENDAQDSHVQWEQLDERYRRDNRNQAEHIGKKLEEIDAVIVPHSNGLPPFTFRKNADCDEVELLAVKEHERWMAAKAAAVPMIQYGPARTDTTHPDYLPWDGGLSQEAKEKDRMFVRALPKLLEDEGLAIVRRPT